MDQNTPTKLVPPFKISSYVSIHPFNWKKTGQHISLQNQHFRCSTDESRLKTTHTNTDGSDFKISKHTLKKMHFLFTTTQQVLLGSEITLILQTPQVNLATLTTHYCCDWIERQFFNSHSKTFWIMTTKQKSAVLRTPLRKILEMISNQIHP